MTTPSPSPEHQDILEHIAAASPRAIDAFNEYSARVFETRGGRLGSGMGTLIEALWGYFTNTELRTADLPFELAWIVDNQFCDFACVDRKADWSEATRAGEHFRIEAKSMNLGADESKGHFDALLSEIGPLDQLLVLIWAWDPSDERRVYPHIRDHFMGSAREIASLRDELHIARGGRFNKREDCADKCSPDSCAHDGEPINAGGRRERRSGPISTRGENVSYAANFGGLVRMLKTNSAQARTRFRELRSANPTAHRYISFVHHNFAGEEASHYSTGEWRSIARDLGVDSEGTKAEIITRVRESIGYQDVLRGLA